MPLRIRIFAMVNKVPNKIAMLYRELSCSSIRWTYYQLKLQKTLPCSHLVFMVLVWSVDRSKQDMKQSFGDCRHLISSSHQIMESRTRCFVCSEQVINFFPNIFILIIIIYGKHCQWEVGNNVYHVTQHKKTFYGLLTFERHSWL